MEQVEKVPGVIGVAPFSINPMMLTHGDATATGVLLKGVDPAASLGAGGAPGRRPGAGSAPPDRRLPDPRAPGGHALRAREAPRPPPRRGQAA